MNRTNVEFWIFIEGVVQPPQNGEVKALSVSVPWLDVFFRVAFCFAKIRLFRVTYALRATFIPSLRNWLRQPLQSLPRFVNQILEIEPNNMFKRGTHLDFPQLQGWIHTRDLTLVLYKTIMTKYYFYIKLLFLWKDNYFM